MNTGPLKAKRRRNALTISRSLQVIAVVVFALIVAVTTDELLRTREALIANTEGEMARLDMVFAEQTGRAIETIDFAIRSANDSMAPASTATGTMPPGTMPPGTIAPDTIAPDTTATDRGLDDSLRRRIAGIRQMSTLLIADATGRITHSSGNDAGQMLPPAGMTLLESFRSRPADELRIGEPMQDAAGKWTVLVARPARARTGQFNGIVAAYLNLGYFEDFYKAVELSDNGAILLHRRDGTVLARYPSAPSLIGQSYHDLPPFKDILARSMAGTVIMDSPLDGSRRILAIRALKLFPLAVNVSVDESVVLRRWRRSTVTFAVAALAAALALVGLLMLLAQRSKQIEALLVEARAAKEAAESAHRQVLHQMDERERAEAALRQAQRMEAIGQLTGGVAHDFNNLLTVVLGNIDLLQFGEPLGTRATEALGTMRAAAERGATLTSQLLAFARRQPLVPRDVNLNELIAGMDDLLQSALGTRIRIETQFAPDIWSAAIDPTQIELVILNLAINGRDAMRGGGTLTIRTCNVTAGPPQRPEDPPAGDHVMLTVADSGTGMPPDILARAFEPFFTTKGPSAGSGLGLPQVLGVATQSGGGVRIESAPGQGTSVHVYLPRAVQRQPVEAAPLPAPAAAERNSRATVLLVDDDRAVRRTVGQLLQSLNYRVQEADTALAALEWLQQRLPLDILLTDLAMPDIAGAELARRAREIRPGLPVVFISGYAEPETITGDIRHVRLVRKPFRPRDLADQIEAALAEVASA